MTTLFDQVPFVAGSPTSHAAAAEIRDQRNPLRQRVLVCIAENGPVTDEEIADLCQMNPSTARPRRIELYRDQKIRQDGTRLTKSGRKAAAWVTT